MTDFTIRRATPTDAPIIAAYNRNMATETEGIDLDLAILLPGVEAALADANKALYFVAEAEGRVIGQIMVTYEWSDWRNGTLWWIQSVYVAKGWRKRGVFRALYDRVLVAGKEAGAVGFRLYAHHENVPALETYRRLGMERTHYVVLEYIPD